MFDGPTNGNWGGKCWSGGRYSCKGKLMGTAAPTDSGDECYQDHDLCISQCDNRSCPGTASADGDCKTGCNERLYKCLGRLSADSKKWSHPPKPGTERDSEDYRKSAMEVFGPWINYGGNGTYVP